MCLSGKKRKKIYQSEVGSSRAKLVKSSEWGFLIFFSSKPLLVMLRNGLIKWRRYCEDCLLNTHLNSKTGMWTLRNKAEVIMRWLQQRMIHGLTGINISLTICKAQVSTKLDLEESPLHQSVKLGILDWWMVNSIKYPTLGGS